MAQLSQHHCTSLVAVHHYEPFQVRVQFDEHGWVLYQGSFATDQDVRAGEADEVGELICSSSLNIKFCPYCGIKLLFR